MIPYLLTDREEAMIHQVEPTFTRLPPGINLPEKLRQLVDSINTEIGAIGFPTAADVSYDNSTSGLSAVDVQAAIDEIAAATGGPPPDATETVKGIAEIATQAETNAGVDDARIVTPAKLRSTVFVNSQIPASAVTQHQTALAITESQISDLSHFDANALHDNVGGEIAALPVAVLAVGDIFVFEDIDDSNLKKKATLSDLRDAAQSGITRSVFFTPLSNGSPSLNGEHVVYSTSSNGSLNIGFAVPSDFGTLTSIQLLGIPSAGAAGPGRLIDFNSDYGAPGEAPTNHQEADVGGSIDLTGTSGLITLIDISSVFTLLGADDHCGFHIDHNSIGGSIDYLGIELTYTTA